jgi:tRNA-modifying protein YgfZ
MDLAKAAKEALIGVKLIDRAGIVLTGKERSSWLNGLVTCDLAKLEAGQGAYGLLVEKKGRIQTDFFVVASKDGEKLLLAVPRDLRDAVLATLDHYLIMEDVEIESQEDDIDVWLLTGPKAVSVAGSAAGLFASGGIVRMTDIAVVATSKANATALEESIAKEGGAVIDDAAWNALRIERGLPRFGIELDATLYPQEASIETFAVSFDKGCYLGQEVVYMLENRGHVKRKLVALDLLEGDGPVDQGAAVMTTEGAQVGDVKSSVLGPISQKPVAIAMVKWAQSKPGTELRIANRPARVREKSLI